MMFRVKNDASHEHFFRASQIVNQLDWHKGGLFLWRFDFQHPFPFYGIRQCVIEHNNGYTYGKSLVFQAVIFLYFIFLLFLRGFEDPWPRVWKGLLCASGLTVTFWPVGSVFSYVAHTSSPTRSCLTLLAHLVCISVCTSQMGILDKTWMFSSMLKHFYKCGLVIKLSHIKTTINLLTHQYNAVFECIKNQIQLVFKDLNATRAHY